MLKEGICISSLAELVSIDDIWENVDESISILFTSSHSKTLILKDSFLSYYYKCRHGYKTHNDINLLYIGTLELFEGLAHLYEPLGRHDVLDRGSL